MIQAGLLVSGAAQAAQAFQPGGAAGGSEMGKSVGGGNPLDPLGILPTPAELLKSAQTLPEQLLAQKSPLELLLGGDSAQQ